MSKKGAHFCPFRIFRYLHLTIIKSSRENEKGKG